MPYLLSSTSLERLQGVDERLVACVKSAIKRSSVDFGVSEGLRTMATQERYVLAGKSQTMDSKHLRGEAVDLVAYIDGKVSWELNVYDDIAAVMRDAAIELELPIRWGAAWNVPDICKWDGGMAAAMNYYIDERRRQGKRPFIDAPHFEIASN